MADNLTNATIDVRANTRGLEQDIRKALKSVELSQIDTKKSSQALGRITGQVSEFNKSLDASNARVIAFGASAGAIFAVEKALSSLISSTVEVEKSLTDINILLNLSTSGLEKFGSSLFGIAKNTAQSFSTVAAAATELSRQGLGVEETLKRTNAALILTRLSGLDAESSVKTLTATLNSFSGSALDAVEVVNKLANVDAAFAVSSGDLANAISRVGSTAQDAGVSLDELIALVTSAQQTTARGGAVIGNSFKTIFTRLQRGKVQDLLTSLGIDVGEGQSAISLLQQLAGVYDTLGSAQKSAVAEQVGGVFQINILKAALGDLSKEYSIYGQALSTSLSSTDQAIQRNELLNKTVSALSSQAVTGLQQAASKIGAIVFEPNAKGMLSGFNTLLDSFNNIDTESVGGKLMTGLFKGIGSFIGGPGAILATAVMVKLFAKLGQFAAGSAKELLGTNKAAQQQAAIEQSILGILQKNSQFTNQILTGKMTTVQAEKELLNYLTAQSNILREQERLSKIIGANLRVSGVSIGASGVPMVAAAAKSGKKAAASGYVPNFASNQAIGQAMENSGARQHGYKAGKASQTTIHDGNGKSFKSFVNSKEDVINFTNAAGNKATMVRPPNGFGKNTQYASKGFVPNFAKKLEAGAETKQSKALSVEQLVNLGGPLKNQKNADLIDTFQSDVTIIRQKKSISEYNRDANTVAQKLLPKFSKRTGKKEIDEKYLDQKIQDYRSAGVDESAILGLKTSVLNANPKNPGAFVNIANRIKGINGEIDASKMLNSKLSSGNAFFDLTSGEEVKTKKRQRIWELVKKSANQYLSTHNIAKNGKGGRPKKDDIRNPVSVVMPLGSQLTASSSGFIPNFAGSFVPNFAGGKMQDRYKKTQGISSMLSREETAKRAANKGIEEKNLGKVPITMIHGGSDGAYSIASSYTGKNKQTGKDTKYTGNITSAGLSTSKLKGKEIQQRVGDALVGSANHITKVFNPSAGEYSSASQLANSGAVGAAAGTVFESALRKAFDGPAKTETGRIDFPSPSPQLQSFFNNAPVPYEAKITDTPGHRSETLGKYVAVKGLSDGYVPNFAKKSGLSFSKNKEDEFGITSFQAMMSGKKVGRFETSKGRDGMIEVGDISVDKANRGKGISGELYKEAIKRNSGKKMKGQILPQMNRLLQKIKMGEPVSAETLFPQIKRADLAKNSVFEVYGHKGNEVEKMTRDQFSSLVNGKINELKNDPKKLQGYFGNIEADDYGGLSIDLQTQHSSGFVPNFADRKVGYLDGDVLSDPKYASIVEEQISKLNIKGGVAEYHKYLGELVNKSRGSGKLKKFTGIFGVPGAGKSSMMLGGQNSEKADNSKFRKTQRIPIITPSDINRVDEVIDTRASPVGTAAAIEGGYWSNLDRMMVLSSSTPKEQEEIKRRRGLRDSEILKGVSKTNFGREAGTSGTGGLDSAYIEAVALDILGAEKTRVMGINSNFGLKRKKEQELPMVERKRLGLAYGAFSPATKGHLEMMEMAKEKGISPEDFIVAVSREGGKLDEKDPHSLRTLAFDQRTRKHLAEKTFRGANVIGAGSDFAGGIRRHLEVSPAGDRRRFFSAQPGSTAFVGSDKQEKDFAKYKTAGYDVSVGGRTEGISGTKAREAILSGNSEAMSKIFPENVLPAINQISPNIKNRTEIIPEVMRRASARIDKDLVPIEQELAGLPSRMSKNTPQDVRDKILALRNRRDKLRSQKQTLPPKILKRLSGMFPGKYGIPLSSSGFVPNFMDVRKGGLPFGTRGRMNYGSAGSKPSAQLGVGAEESTLAHELFHGAYSRSTVKNAQSNPAIGRFLSDPKKYAGVNSIFASSIFKGLNQKSLYSSLGLNDTQLDFDGKNPGATYRGPKAVDEIVTRIQEKVFKNKGNLDSLSGDEKTFVKNLEQQGLISDKRMSNVSRRSQEGSKFRKLVGDKFSSVMGSSSGFVPNFAKQKLADSPAFTNFYTDSAKPGVLEVGSIQNFEGPEQTAVIEKYLKNKITQLGIKQIDGGSTNLPPRYLKKYSQRLGVPISGYIGGDKFGSLSKKRQAAYDPYTTSKNIFGGREFNVKSGGFVPNFARFKSSPYFEEDGSHKRGHDGGKYISFGNGASREGMISLAKAAGLQFALDGFPLKTKQNSFLFNKFLNQGQSERMSIYGEPDGGVHVKDGNHRLALGRYLGLKTFNNVDMKAQGFVPNFAAKVGMQKQRNALASSERGGIVAVHRIKPLIKDGRVSFSPSNLPTPGAGPAMVHHLEGMSGPSGHFPFANFLRLAREREMDPRYFERNNFEWYYTDTEADPKKKRLSSGFVPNFSNALNDAIAREKSSGLSSGQIYVDKHSSLRNSGNPMGLMVANRRDEPGGGIQGINRAKREGRNPKTYGGGMSSGFVPNFALFGPGQADLDALKELNDALKSISEKIKDAADNFSVPDTENKVKKIEARKARLESAAPNLTSTQILTSKDDEVAAKQLLLDAQKTGNQSDIDEADKLLAEARKKTAKLESDLKAKIEARVRSLDEQIKAGKDSVVAYEKEQAALLEEKTSIESGRSSQIKGMGAVGRTKKFISKNSMGIGMGLQAVAGMTAEFAGNDDTKEGRGVKAAVGGAGEIASFAGTGAMIAGPWGALAGGLLGAAKTIYDVNKAMKSKVPDLEKGFQSSSDSMARFGESGQKLLQLNEQYASALSSGDPTQAADVMVKTQQAYAEELDKLTQAQRASMISAIAQGRGQEEYAKILSEMQSSVGAQGAQVSLEKFGESKSLMGMGSPDKSLIKGMDKSLSSDFTKGLSAEDIKKALAGAYVTDGAKGGAAEYQAISLMESLAGSDSLSSDRKVELQKVIESFASAAGKTDLGEVAAALIKNIQDKPKLAEDTKGAQEAAAADIAKKSEIAKKEIAIRERTNASLLKLQSDTQSVYEGFNSSVEDFISTVASAATMRANAGKFKENFVSAAGAPNAAAAQNERNIISGSKDKTTVDIYQSQLDASNNFNNATDTLLGGLDVDMAKLGPGANSGDQQTKLSEARSSIQQALLPIQGMIMGGDYEGARAKTKEALSGLDPEQAALVGAAAIQNVGQQLDSSIRDGARKSDLIYKNSQKDLAIQAQQLVFQKASAQLAKAQNFGGGTTKDIITNTSETGFGKAMEALTDLKSMGYSQENLVKNERKPGDTTSLDTYSTKDGKKTTPAQAGALLDFYSAASSIGGGEPVMDTGSKDYAVIVDALKTKITGQMDALTAKNGESGGSIVDRAVFSKLEAQLAALGGDSTVAQLKVMKDQNVANVGGKQIQNEALKRYSGAAFDGLSPELKTAFNATNDENAGATFLLVAGQQTQTATLSQGLEFLSASGATTNDILSNQPAAIAEAIGAILEQSRTQTSSDKATDELGQARSKAAEVATGIFKLEGSMQSNNESIDTSKASNAQLNAGGFSVEELRDPEKLKKMKEQAKIGSSQNVSNGRFTSKEDIEKYKAAANFVKASGNVDQIEKNNNNIAAKEKENADLQPKLGVERVKLTGWEADIKDKIDNVAKTGLAASRAKGLADAAKAKTMSYDRGGGDAAAGYYATEAAKKASRAAALGVSDLNPSALQKQSIARSSGEQTVTTGDGIRTYENAANTKYGEGSNEAFESLLRDNVLPSLENFKSVWESISGGAGAQSAFDIAKSSMHGMQTPVSGTPPATPGALPVPPASQTGAPPATPGALPVPPASQTGAPPATPGALPVPPASQTGAPPATPSALPVPPASQTGDSQQESTNQLISSILGIVQGMANKLSEEKAPGESSANGTPASQGQSGSVSVSAPVTFSVNSTAEQGSDAGVAVGEQIKNGLVQFLSSAEFIQKVTSIANAAAGVKTPPTQPRLGMDL